MTIQLYFAPVSCALVPFILLTEADAKFELCPLNIRGNQQRSDEYLKLNPKHKVPLLVVDGQPLSENVAIQFWIANNFPQAKLLPAGQWDAAQAISLLAWFASGIHPNISRYTAPLKFCSVSGTEDDTKGIARKSLLEALRIAEDRLKGRNFFFDHFTASDAYFFWCFRRINIFDIDLSEFTNCAAHHDRLLERSSVQAATAYDAQLITEFGIIP